MLSFTFLCAFFVCHETNPGELKIQKSREIVLKSLGSSRFKESCRACSRNGYAKRRYLLLLMKSSNSLNSMGCCVSGYSSQTKGIVDANGDGQGRIKYSQCLGDVSQVLYSISWNEYKPLTSLSEANPTLVCQRWLTCMAPNVWLMKL